MRKERIPVFLMVCLAVGVLFVFMMVGRLLPEVLVGVFRIIAIVLVAMGLILIVSLTMLWALKKKKSILISLKDDNEGNVSLQDCINDIARYLRDNESTPFFRGTLEHISMQLGSFQNRFDNVYTALEGRFGRGGLSYNKFSVPVEDLKSYLVKLIGNLLFKMVSFNEEEYADKIERFRESNRIDDVESHMALENEYKDYAVGVIRQLDNAILKMDKLILEMYRLNDAELEKSMGVLCAIDNTISDTRFYS